MQKTTRMTRIKQIAAIVIIVATIVVFVLYIHTHPELISTLLSLDVPSITLLLTCYAIIVLVNAFILHHSLLLLSKRMPAVENVLLTGYSSIVNFFGPLQSGPGFRAIYLKSKHGVRIRDFLGTSLVFYGFFAFINGLIITIAVFYTFNSPLATVALAVAIMVAAAATYLIAKRSTKIAHIVKNLGYKNKSFWLIGLGALLVTVVTVGIYFIEIAHVDSSILLIQVIIYSAAANLALFVSITPGAIGIRESFLVLTNQLHQIDTSIVIAASVIDRAVYLGFLVLLFVILLAINSRKHLGVFQLKRQK